MPEPVPHQESVYAALLTAAAGVLTTALTLLVGWLHDRSMVPDPHMGLARGCGEQQGPGQA
jgi:hypothetical protein